MSHATPQQQQQELDHLILLVAEGQATAAEEQRLAARLRAAPAARRRYVEYLQLHSLLQWEYSAAPIGVAEPRPVARRARPPAWPIFGGAWALGVCLTLLLMLRPLTAPTPVQPEPPGVARVDRVYAARWAGQDEAIESGQSLSPGPHHLVDGVMEISVGNDVQLVVESPAHFELESPSRMRLLSGRMAARIAPRAIGFTIATSRADVVDQGTEFGVAIGPQQQTLVQVFDGEVIAQLRQPDHQGDLTRRVAAGKAVRIDSRKGAARVSDLPFVEERFVRRLPQLGNDAYTWLPPYNASRYDRLHVVPAPAEVQIDGRLADWDRSGMFTSRLREPFGRQYYVEGAMMYDEKHLYIGAHIGDPAPMRNVISPEMEPEMYWKGGGLQVRLSTDPNLGWPLEARSAIPSGEQRLPGGGRRPQDNSPNIIHLTLWYHGSERRPCLALQYGMNFHPLVTNPHLWRGAFQKDPDGQGYTLEYAIPWSLLHAAERPPRPGDDLAVCWQVHWSDATGRIWRGHLVEFTRPEITGLAFLRADKWGRAIYHAQGDLPPSIVEPKAAGDGDETAP